MTQSLAKALGSHNISVAAVAPGFVDTDMAASVLAGPNGPTIKADCKYHPDLLLSHAQFWGVNTVP